MSFQVSVARGEISAAASVDAQREIMKEGELLQEEEDGEEDMLVQESVGDGAVAVLSLDEVPYDRDLKYCNRATDERVHPQSVNRVINPFLSQVR